MSHLVRRPGVQVSGSRYLLSSDRLSFSPADIIRQPQFHSDSIYRSHISFWICQQLPDSRTNRSASPSSSLLSFTFAFYPAFHTWSRLLTASYLSALYVYVCVSWPFRVRAVYIQNTCLSLRSLRPRFAWKKISIADFKFVLMVSHMSCFQLSDEFLFAELHLSSSISPQLGLPAASPSASRRGSAFRADNLFLFVSQLCPVLLGKERWENREREEGTRCFPFM